MRRKLADLKEEESDELFGNEGAKGHYPNFQTVRWERDTMHASSPVLPMDMSILS